MSTLRELSERAHDNSDAHGFWSDLPSLAGQEEARAIYYGNKLMLIVGEVSEAHEELRKNPDPTHVYHRPGDLKPEGLPYELADVLIRVFDLAGHLDLPLDELVAAKMAFNESRPHKHGKGF